jgi:hypothetical protein
MTSRDYFIATMRGDIARWKRQRADAERAGFGESIGRIIGGWIAEVEALLLDLWH